MAVGRRLKLLRQENEISMNKVHLETRMSTSYLTKLEDDQFVPQEPNLKRIIKALKTLEVSNADVLIKEHKAVQKERDMLATLQQRLAEIDDPDQRLQVLEGLVKKVPALTP